MKNLIGKNWVDSNSDNVIEVRNPATNELIDVVYGASEKDVTLAVSEAKKAYNYWANISVFERGEIMRKFSVLLKENISSLAQLLSRETGKPINEAYSEINRTNFIINEYIEESRHLLENVKENNDIYNNTKEIHFEQRTPIGVVACIMPFNLPSYVFSKKVIPAIIMGNVVVLKPSSNAPLTLTKYVELMIESGIPYGVIQVLNGTGDTVGVEITKNQGIDLISLTGKRETGVLLKEQVKSNSTILSLNLSSNDCFIVCEDADITSAVEETLKCRLYNTGQVCYGGKRFLIHNSLKDKFVSSLSSKMRTLKIGNPIDPKVNIGCLINEKAAINVQNQVNKTIQEGAKIVVGGRRRGAYFEPTILSNITSDMSIAKDMEICGPVIPIIGYDDIEEAIKIANQSEKTLSGSIITKNIDTAIKISKKLNAEKIVINGSLLFETNAKITDLTEMTHVKTIVLRNV